MTNATDAAAYRGTSQRPHRARWAISAVISGLRRFNGPLRAGRNHNKNPQWGGIAPGAPRPRPPMPQSHAGLERWTKTGPTNNWPLTDLEMLCPQLAPWPGTVGSHREPTPMQIKPSPAEKLPAGEVAPPCPTLAPTPAPNPALAS